MRHPSSKSIVVWFYFFFLALLAELGSNGPLFAIGANMYLNSYSIVFGG